MVPCELEGLRKEAKRLRSQMLKTKDKGIIKNIFL